MADQLRYRLKKMGLERCQPELETPLEVEAAILVSSSQDGNSTTLIKKNVPSPGSNIGYCYID